MLCKLYLSSKSNMPVVSLKEKKNQKQAKTPNVLTNLNEWLLNPDLKAAETHGRTNLTSFYCIICCIQFKTKGLWFFRALPQKEYVCVYILQGEFVFYLHMTDLFVYIFSLLHKRSHFSWKNKYVQTSFYLKTKILTTILVYLTKYKGTFLRSSDIQNVH